MANPHPVDVRVGERIRLRRRATGVTQQKLADRIGLTFQQVQKYERGMNRVSASKLVEIAAALETNAADLLGEMPSETDPFRDELRLLGQPGAVELCQAYAQIGSKRLRRSVLALVSAIATTGESTDDG